MNWFFTKQKVVLQAKSPIIEEYVASKKDRSNQLKLPFQEAKFIVFDTETTGFDIKFDHILSIGAVTVQDSSILLNEALEVFLKAPDTNKKEHVEIHQILPSLSVKAIKQSVAIEKFIELVSTNILVGHHVDYDISMVSHKMNSLFGIKLFNHYLDTGALAIRLENPPNSTTPIVGKNYTLDSLCERYSIPTADRHNAAGDAYITAQLLIKLLKQAEIRGLKTVKDLATKRATTFL